VNNTAHLSARLDAIERLVRALADYADAENEPRAIRALGRVKRLEAEGKKPEERFSKIVLARNCGMWDL
jgi:hypothetical protein